MVSVIAYTYKGQTYHPACIIDAMPTGEGEAFDGWGLVTGEAMSAEQFLADLAHAFGINRDTCIDSEFPVPVTSRIPLGICDHCSDIIEHDNESE